MYDVNVVCKKYTLNESIDLDKSINVSQNSRTTFTKSIDDLTTNSLNSFITTLKQKCPSLKILDIRIDSTIGGGISSSLQSIVVLAKLENYASYLNGTDSRFKLVSHIILEDGTSFFIPNSFVVKMGSWYGVISEHQLPQVFAQDEVYLAQNYTRTQPEKIDDNAL